MQEMLKKHTDKLRFGVVGVLNTAIDFCILFVLVSFGLPVIASNFVSTSVALLFSFFANKKFTFKHTDKTTGRHFASFLIITLFGLWVIQPIIIESTRILTGQSGLDSRMVLLAGKLLATCVSLIWNYLLYRKFVFRKTSI